VDRGVGGSDFNTDSQNAFFFVSGRPVDGRPPPLPRSSTLAPFATPDGDRT